MLLWPALLCAVACGEREEGSPPPGGGDGHGDGGGTAADGGSGREGEGEGEGQGDGWPALAELRWTSEVGEVDGQPESLRLAAGPDGSQVGLAYLLGGEAGGSCELGSRSFPLQQWQLRHRRLGSPAGSEQTLATTDVSFGLGFAVTGEGTSLLAMLGGPHGQQFCGGSDLLLVSGPPWAVRTVQASSATGATCSKMQDVCNKGDVTGLWPALAVRGERLLLAFQDIHFGFTKEDWDSADLEVAEGPDWTVSTADDSRGAGAYGSAAIGEDGTFAVAFHNPTLGGIWLSRRAPAAAASPAADGEGRGWQSEQVDGHATSHPVNLAARPDGGFGIAFFEPGDRVLLLAEIGAGPEASWQTTPVDERASTGHHPQLAYTSRGRAVVAYRQCHRQTGRADCDAQYDGVWLAVREPGATRWQQQELANDPEALDGETLAMVLPGGDGLPVIALSRSRLDPVERQLVRQLVLLQGQRP